MDTQLSKHFTLAELTRSATATRHNIDNTPPAEVVKHLRLLAQEVLEPLRCRFGVLRITSGYRCEELNRRVGGVKNSQHLTGDAADLHLSTREEGEKMRHWALEKHLPVRQILVEYNRNTGARWLHIGRETDAKPQSKPQGLDMAPDRCYLCNAKQTIKPTPATGLNFRNYARTFY